MRVSYRWLQELLPALQAPPAEVADLLTNVGLEVEGIEVFGAGLESILVAEVKRIEPHPEREKLRLVTVDRGGEEQRVVCGAGNVPGPGGLVALAPLGTTLPAVGMTLTPRKIGGILSEGMICSEVEMGLAEASEGILILPTGIAKPGTPLADALPVQDTIFEVGVTPNRPDALSHVGVARDLAALLAIELCLPPVGEPQRTADAELSRLVAIDNRDRERCPRYGARAVLDVKIGPSPLWMQYRLFSLGIRPISNVVDVTNLLLLEWGQPMHAFDLDRVRGGRIVVRRAAAGEPFTTLDGVERKLDADDLVIGDAEGPTALAGVMGGAVSEIHDGTERVLLECAYFTPRGVRRTSRRQGLSSDSSFRFERGTDWGDVPVVLDRAANLLGELCGGAVVPGAIIDDGELPPIPTITLRSSRLDALLGVAVPFDEALAILARLGLEVTSTRGEGTAAVATVRGASWRPDIAGEHDLIEEVARIRGLDAIPTVLPPIVPQKPRISGKLERTLTDLASQLGLSEALTYAFVSPAELAALNAPPAVVSLLNPLTEERSVMRTSLLPGLLESLRRARRRGERAVRLFTTGTLFLPPLTARTTGASQAARPQLDSDLGVIPEQRPAFAAILAGPRPAYLERPETDVYDAKGLALELVERVTQQPAEVRLLTAPDAASHLHPRGKAEVVVAGRPVGVLGPLHPEVVDALDLDGAAFVVELDLVALEQIEARTPKYRPIPRLPAVTRDVSLEVGEQLLAGDLAAAIRAAAGELCESVELIDRFTGKSLPDGTSSLTYRLTYRDPKAATDPDHARTLTDKEVDKCQTSVNAAAEKLGAKLRA